MTDAANLHHNLVPFAAFLDYRARRMRAPVANGEPPTPEAPTRPADPTGPHRRADAKVVPIASER